MKPKSAKRRSFESAKDPPLSSLWNPRLPIAYRTGEEYKTEIQFHTRLLLFHQSPDKNKAKGSEYEKQAKSTF
jgi:hypothetical protein